MNYTQDKSASSPIKPPEINWWLERRRLYAEELSGAADIIILSLSKNPKTAWKIMEILHKRFGILLSSGTLYPKLKKLKGENYTIPWKKDWRGEEKRYGAKISKLCLSLGPVQERFLLGSMEARRRVLSYAGYQPFEKKVIDQINAERGEKLVKNLRTQYAKKKIEPLILNNLFGNPKRANYALAIRNEIESALEVKLNDATVPDALNYLLERGIVRYAVDECPNCGKPEGWVFDESTGRPQKLYGGTPCISGKYYDLSMKAALDVSLFLAELYEDQFKDPVDFTDWPHMRPEQLMNKP